MIRVARGVLVGGGLGFALFVSSDSGLEIYLAALALAVLVGVLIPLEAQDRRMAEMLTELRGIRRRLDELEVVALDDGGAEEEDDEEDSPLPLRFSDPAPDHRDGEEEERYIPAIQSGAGEARTVMPHARRTVERSVEDVARKLASMQRGE